MNGITYLSFNQEGVDNYQEGASFIVPAEMNVVVFAGFFSGSARFLPGSATWGQCQTLGADFAWKVSKASTLMLIPDSLYYPEPELDQLSDACQIDEALNRKGSNQCELDSECSGERRCSIYGWCQGTSGCPEACEIDEAINALGPNQCDKDI